MTNTKALRFSVFARGRARVMGATRRENVHYFLSVWSGIRFATRGDMKRAVIGALSILVLGCEPTPATTASSASPASAHASESATEAPTPEAQASDFTRGSNETLAEAAHEEPAAEAAEAEQAPLAIARRFRVENIPIDYQQTPDLERGRVSQTRVVAALGFGEAIGQIRGPRGHAPWLFEATGWSSPFVVWFEGDPAHVYDLSSSRPRRYPLEPFDPSAATVLTEQAEVRFLNRCPSGAEVCFVFGENVGRVDDPGAPGGWVVSPYTGAPEPGETVSEREIAKDTYRDVHVHGRVRGPREDIYFRDQLAFSVHADEEVNAIVFPDGDDFVVYARDSSAVNFSVHASRHDATGRRLGAPTQVSFRLGGRQALDCIAGLDAFPVLVSRRRGFAFAWTSQKSVDTRVYVYDGHRASRVTQAVPPGTDPDAYFLDPLQSLAVVRGGALVFRGDAPLAMSWRRGERSLE